MMTTTTTMRAVTQDRYGDADVLALRAIDRPMVGDGEVLVAVRAAGYDPAKDLVGGNGPVQFLTARVTGVASPAAAAKAALGARALGMNPKAIAGTDLLARVTFGADVFCPPASRVESRCRLGCRETTSTVPDAHGWTVDAARDAGRRRLLSTWAWRGR